MLRFLLFALSALLPAASAAQDGPASLQPPSPSILAASYAASGVQIYACTLEAGATEWALKAPEAQLVDAGGTAIIHHFAGPTWQARDGSKVVGTLRAMVPSPDAGAIPWLLVQTTVTGQGLLAGTRYVVRRDTRGGVAPGGRCAAGATTRVPYTATYAFYR